MSYETYQRPFPQYLSAPIQVLFWESDEVALIMIFFCVAQILGGWTWLVIIGGPWVYSRIKKDKPRGFLKHILYALGLMQIPGCPGFFDKEFHE